MADVLKFIIALAACIALMLVIGLMDSHSTPYPTTA